MTKSELLMLMVIGAVGYVAFKKYVLPALGPTGSQSIVAGVRG